MNERAIVDKIQKYLKAQKCFVMKIADKFTSGIPDLIVVTQTGRVIFLEVKTPVGKLSRIQEYVIEQLKLHNAEAYVVISVDEVKNILTKS